MSFIFSYAYTTPFPKGSKITWAEAFEALRYKAAAPMSFVPAIAAAEVLEQNAEYIKRKTTMKTGVQMLEDIHLYAPSLVTFKADNGQLVTNLISENAQGELLMTFTFHIPFPDTKSGSEAAEAKLKEMKELAKGAVLQSMKTTLAMSQEGKFN
ncbi:kinase domain protein [Rhizoctonia solani]|uniref:Kinase domain protein n=1 Tax=Rhizoctonia solani TaxID=456999 RepID=A0A8H8SYK0_9AGAM|nr:kinase domain protein [Rhizoctonia solani]QRW22589.1 kinase domain protein [Rhizoctonia solani]